MLILGTLTKDCVYELHLALIEASLLSNELHKKKSHATALRVKRSSPKPKAAAAATGDPSGYPRAMLKRIKPPLVRLDP
jgi:hypothetical protein